jgi:phage FluMu gp28-like protein
MSKLHALKEELLRTQRELKKRIYMTNPKAFISDLCKIRLEGGGIGDFKLWDFQEEAIDNIMSNSKVVILKARQMGFSWVNAGLFVFWALFNDEVDLVIMSKTEKDAILQLKRIKFILKHLPAEFQMKILVDNAQELSLANGTTIYSVTSSGDSGRGITGFRVLWDEAAFSENAEAIKRALEPSANK